MSRALARQRLLLTTLLILLLLTFGLRLYDLDGKSLWSDEGLSVHRAQGDLAYILSNHITIQGVVTQDTQPPLYFLLLHAIMRGAGEGDFSLKFLSVAFSVLTVPLLYVLGRRLFDGQVGLLAAVLGAASPLYLWYAQELRMYMALVALSLASTYALVRAGEGRAGWQPRWAVAYVLATAATLYTHYSALFLLLFQGLAFAALALRRRWIWLMGLLALAALSIVPVIPFVARRLLTGAELHYQFVPLTTILRDLWNAFSLGMSVDPWAPAVLALDALFLAVALIGLVSPPTPTPPPYNEEGGWRWGPWRLRRASFLLGYLLIPILALYVASYVKPMYQSVRHLIIASPPYYLALAVGLAALRKRGRALFLSVASLLLLGAGYSSASYFFDPSYAKDDLRGMIRYVEEHSFPGDLIVLSDPVILPVFDHYYRGQQPRTAVPPFGIQADAGTIEGLRSLLAGYRRVWFLYGPPSALFDPQAMVKRWLDESLFKVDEVWFHGLDTVVAAAGYTTSWPILDRLPADVEGPQANLGNQLGLLGLDPLPNPLIAGSTGLINLYWRPLTPPTPPRSTGGDPGGPWNEEGLGGADYKMALSLVDDAGHIWGQGDKAPFNGLYPTTQWPVGKVIRVNHELRVDPGAPPGTYWLRLRVYRSDTGEALDAIGEDGNPGGPWVDLAQVRVVRPAEPPPPTAIAPQHPFSARWEAGLRMVGFDLVSQTFEPGDPVPLAFYYRVQKAPGRDYVLRMELVDAVGRAPFGAHLPPVRADYPASQWRAGDVLKGQHTLVLPADLPAGSYRLRLSLIEPDSDRFVPVRHGWWPLPRRSVSLTSIQVQARHRAFQAPPMQHRLDAPFGDSITLLGYDLGAAQVQPGQALDITLYWGAQAVLPLSYKVTVQLLSDEGRIVGQDDAVPAGWTRPTTGWLPGEVITDPHRLLVRAETPPGRYTLIAALYDEGTGERLPVSPPQSPPVERQGLGGGVDDRIILGTVQVEEVP